MYSDNYDPFGFQNPYFGDRFSSSYGRRRRQEVARHQRLMEEERRRKAAHERRKRVEEQMAIEERQRRREMEMLQAERNKIEKMRRQRLEKEQPNEMPDYLPPGTIMRGPDGNLYRIAPPSHRKRDDISEPCPDINNERNPSISSENKENAAGTDTPEHGSPECNDSADNSPLKNRLNSNHTHDVTDSASPMQEDVPLPEIVMENAPDEEDDELREMRSAHDVTESASPMQEDVPLPKIVVENVPNEEDDELREMRSVWRNRVPSPGQWMEPVESFCRLG